MFRRSIAVLIPTFIILILASPILSTVRADPDSVRVFAPTAYLNYEHGVGVGSGNAKMLDMDVAGIDEEMSYIQASSFTSPYYEAYWDPYDNRSFFPPDDATIISVHMIAIVRCQIPQPFFLSLEFYNHTTSSLTQITSGTPYFTATGANTLYSYNITNGGLAPVWTPTILKDTANWGAPNWEEPETQYGVKVSLHVDSWYGGTSRALYVDYVGLDYVWTNTTIGADPGAPGTTFNPVSVDVTGLLGIIGFVGMIGVPAASIWFLRQDGGSKIYTGVMALVAFTVCFGFFYGSINGG